MTLLTWTSHTFDSLRLVFTSCKELVAGFRKLRGPLRPHVWDLGRSCTAGSRRQVPAPSHDPPCRLPSGYQSQSNHIQPLVGWKNQRSPKEMVTPGFPHAFGGESVLEPSEDPPNTTPRSPVTPQFYSVQVIQTDA